MFVCSDTDYCEGRHRQGHTGTGKDPADLTAYRQATSTA